MAALGLDEGNDVGPARGYVVRCPDLLVLKQQWDAIIRQQSEEVPEAVFEQTEAQVEELAKTLSEDNSTVLRG